MHTQAALPYSEPCWNCGENHFIVRGFDEWGDPITVCTSCHERQEED